MRGQTGHNTCCELDTFTFGSIS